MERKRQGINFRILTFAVLSVLVPARATLFAQSEETYRIRAAFVLNFVRMMTLPPGVPGTGGTLKVCVSGDEALRTFSRALNDKEFGTGRISVSAPTGSCDLLYIAPGADRPVEEPHAALIDEEGDMCARRSHIQFYLSEGKLRFKINNEALREKGTVLSSQVLKLAKIVTCE